MKFKKIIFSLFIIIPAVSSINICVYAQNTDDNNVAWEIMQQLRSQYRQIKSVEAHYKVSVNNLANKSVSSNDLKYFSQSNKFYFENTLSGMINDKQVQRTVIQANNGKNVKRYSYDKMRDYKHGLIDKPKKSIIENDYILSATAALTVHEDKFYVSTYEQGTHKYKHLGKDDVGGVQCTKICLVSPYKAGAQAYTYFWVEKLGNVFRMHKTNCLIEDRPDKLLYENSYTYNNGNQGFLPDTAKTERYSLKKTGKNSKRIIKDFSFDSVAINQNINPEVFELEFPNGTWVQDFLLEFNYEAGGKEMDIDDTLNDLVALDKLNELDELDLSSNGVDSIAAKEKKRNEDLQSESSEVNTQIATEIDPFLISNIDKQININNFNKELYLVFGIFLIILSFVFIIVYFLKVQRAPELVDSDQ